MDVAEPATPRPAEVDAKMVLPLLAATWSFEVGEVVPELVSWEADGDSGRWAQSLAYDRVTALAVEAIKEQQRTLEGLRRTSDGLREQLDGLMRRTATREGERGAAR